MNSPRKKKMLTLPPALILLYCQFGENDNSPYCQYYINDQVYLPNLLIWLWGEDTLDVIDMIFLQNHICCKSEKGEMWYHGKQFFTENLKSCGTRVKTPVWLNSLRVPARLCKNCWEPPWKEAVASAASLVLWFLIK